MRVRDSGHGVNLGTVFVVLGWAWEREREGGGETNACTMRVWREKEKLELENFILQGL